MDLERQGVTAGKTVARRGWIEKAVPAYPMRRRQSHAREAGATKSYERAKSVLHQNAAETFEKDRKVRDPLTNLRATPNLLKIKDRRAG
jgi:hypothetical protein